MDTMLLRKRRIFLLVVVLLSTCYLVVIHILSVFEAFGHKSRGISLVLSNALTESFTPGFPLDTLSLNDSSQLINLANFRFLINPACSESPYIVVIHSAPGNHRKRHLIRFTWRARVPLYFMFGETDTHQGLLDAEAATYHDVVQGSFIDSYRNLTYKHAMLFKWIVYHCPRVRYVLKVDDDVFVNVDRLGEFLTRTLSPYGTRRLLMCTLWRHSAAERSGKWKVSLQEYPLKEYPTYCEGAAVLYSPDVIFNLYQTLQEDGTYFWIDDVFVTGIVFSKLNLSHAEFNWWEGNELLRANRYEDLARYDPRKNMFVLIREEIYEHNNDTLFEHFLSSGSRLEKSPCRTAIVDVET